MQRTHKIASQFAALDPKLVYEAIKRSDNNIKFEPNKPKPGVASDTTWFTVKVSLDDGKTWNELILAYVSKSAGEQSISVGFGAQDPSMQEGNQKTFVRSFTLTEESGGWYYKAIAEINRVYPAHIKKLVADKKFAVTDDQRFRIIPMIATTYSSKSKNAEKRGKPLEKPTTNVKLEFGKSYPAKHPIAPLQGKPYCTVYDMRIEPKFENGKPVFTVATVDGQPLGLNNAHRVVTSRSQILGGFTVFNCSYNKDDVNLTQRGHIIRIIPAESSDIDEGEDYDYDGFAMAQAPAPQKPTTLEGITAEIKEKTEQEITDGLFNE